MITTIRRGFTLIELLVVISIILVLASLGLMVARPIWGMADRVECANHIRQIGTELIKIATTTGRFPSGGEHPGAWGDGAALYSQVVSGLRAPGVMRCPASDSSEPTHPHWAASSYIYLGNLTPTYECECSACRGDEGDEASPIWTIHWAGVAYASGHDRSSDYTLNLSNLDLADNIRFNRSESERSNPTHPIVPDDLQMNRDRSRRALRQTPYWAHDESGGPRLADIVVLTERPSGSSWGDAHTKITEANRNQITFYANHVSGSANSKSGWGAHVVFASGNVVWKDWDELRFQLRVLNAGGDGEDHFYFF